MNQRAGWTAVVAMVGACAQIANAGGVSKSTPRAEVSAILSAVAAATVRGESAATVAGMLYSSDVVLVGEGDPEAKRGMQGATADVAAWWASLGPNGQRGCTLALAGPEISSATTFTSFVVIHCAANPPTLAEALDVRCLYSWKKLPQGWRVALEQWGVGKL